MKADNRDAWITKAVEEKSYDFRPTLIQGIKETSDKILEIINDMSIVDLPLAILAVREVEQTLMNSSMAKATNAVGIAERISRMYKTKYGETQIAIPKDLYDRIKEKMEN